MKELINFIPRTATECMKLLTALSDSPDGATLRDRYGNEERLDAEETGTLAKLIGSQIGARPKGRKRKPANTTATRNARKK